MAQKTIYLNGVKELTVPQGEKIALSNYGGGTAIIYYESDPGNVPQKWYEQQRLTNSSVVLGTFAADQNVRIEANDSTVLYEVAVTPTGQVINAPAGTEIVFNDDGLDVDIRMESVVNDYTFFMEGSSGNVGIGNSTMHNWRSEYSILQIGGNAAVYANSDLSVGNQLSLCQNTYNDGVAWRYISTDEASQIYLGGGEILLRGVASGTANTSVFWIRYLLLSLTETVFNEDGSDIDFRVESDTKTHALFIDGATGNIGFNTSALISWGSGYPFHQLGDTNSISVRNSTTDQYVAQNMYRDAANAYKCVVDASSSLYLQSGQQHAFLSALTGGAADAAISVIECLRFTSSTMIINEDGVDMDFRIESDTKTHALFIDGATGNIGFNTSALIAWGSGYPFHQLGDTNSISVRNSTTDQYVAQNMYRDAANAFKCVVDASSSLYLQSGQQHAFYSALTGGAADAAISVIECLRFTSSTMIINDDGVDMDFRIESATNINAFNIEGSSSNIGIGTTDFGGAGPGVGVIGIANATAPSANPTGGGVLFVDSVDGALKFRGAGGTVTSIAPT